MTLDNQRERSGLFGEIAIELGFRSKSQETSYKKEQKTKTEEIITIRIPAVNNVIADSQLAHHPNNVSGQVWRVSNLSIVILSKQD